MKTLVIGAAILDIIMKIKHLPVSGEDILCSETASTVGGCAYNVAATLRNFEMDHDLFVPVGRGMYGDIISENLKNLGYDILIRDEEKDNGYCLCLVEEDGERTFITVKGTEGCFRESWFDCISPEDYDKIYVAGYQVSGPGGEAVSKWMKGLVGKTIFFAPGPVINEIDKSVMEDIFSVNPILHLNEKEAFDYTGEGALEDCLKALYRLNRNTVFVTLGAKGTCFYQGDRLQVIEACQSEVADTIGAGDSHVAALIAGYSMGLEMEERVRLANAVAAGVVGIQGPVMSKEIFDQHNFLSQLKTAEENSHESNEKFL